jgi:hypothetical protein
MAATDYKRLYYKTDEIISRFKPSLSNYFDVFVSNSTFGKVSNSDINFLAYEAVLPGTSLQTTEVFGDRQGLTQTYANKRVYPPVDVSFYIDADYKVLEFFEQWISFISPNKGDRGSSYQKFNYPGVTDSDGYKRTVIITKFEREFRSLSQRLVKDGTINVPKQLTFELLGAYPTNLVSVPVSYEGSNLLRTTVTFNYDVYHFENTALGTRTRYGLDGKASNSSAQPGGDSGITLGDLNRQVRLINENLPEQRVTSIPSDVG